MLTSKRKNNILFWVLQIIGWSLYTIVSNYLFAKSKNRDIEGALLFYLTYILGFLITCGLRYYYRFLRRKVYSLNKLIYILPLSLLITVFLWNFIDILISMNFWEEKAIHKYLKHTLTFRGLMKINYFPVVILGTWTALYFGIKYWMDSQQHKESAEKATLLAQQAQLQMLRYQLNPHFLFNSLNSIRALIEEDKNSAKEMVTELSEFLRYSLIIEDSNYRTVQEEIEAIKLYFAIEKKRFEEKLDVSFDICDETKSIEIPGFLIHPLVENAVKYGMKTSKMPLQIKIKSRLENKSLVIEVTNSGKWLEPDDPDKFELKGTGKGLNNVKQRLKNSFENRYNFILITKENSVTAKIEIQLNND